MAEGAVAFMMSMGKTGYLFPTIAVIEITGGGLLIAGRMIPFALVILAPIVYNILMFHALLDPKRCYGGYNTERLFGLDCMEQKRIIHRTI